MTELNPKALRFIVIALDLWVASIEVQLSAAHFGEDATAELLNDLGFVRALANRLREAKAATAIRGTRPGWQWETASLQERGDWIRQHARWGISIAQLCELFDMDERTINPCLQGGNPYGASTTQPASSAPPHPESAAEGKD